MKISLPVSVSKSKVIPCLFEFMKRNTPLPSLDGVSLKNGLSRRDTSPPRGDSTLMTVAPMSARYLVQNGPDIYEEASITVMSDRG